MEKSKYKKHRYYLCFLFWLEKSRAVPLNGADLEPRVNLEPWRVSSENYSSIS